MSIRTVTKTGTIVGAGWLVFVIAAGAYSSRRVTAGSLSPAAPAVQTQLKIVVLEGEDGVNIIDQKTAVKPIVEVRDKDDLPVAGASVLFLFRGGGGNASLNNGVTQVTLTTDAAGRASVTVNPLSRGAVQLEVRASFQGQTATTTISQTNFQTAAQAAQAGKSPGSQSGQSSGSSGGGAGGAAASGLSAALIGGIVAGGVGGAVLVAKAVGSKETPNGPPTGGTVDGAPQTLILTIVRARDAIPGTYICVGRDGQGFSNQRLASGPFSLLRTGMSLSSSVFNGTMTGSMLSLYRPPNSVRPPDTYEEHLEATLTPDGPNRWTLVGEASGKSVVPIDGGPVCGPAIATSTWSGESFTGTLAQASTGR